MMVEIVDVTFGYGPQLVLDGISGRLQSGESVALVGDNGAGKTTLTRLLMGLEQAAKGKIVVGGVEPSEPSRLTPLVGYVFQHPARQLFARTVQEEMLFSCRQLGLDAGAALARADHLLERIGLPDIALTHPHDLSPGQQKLVAFASALTHQPKLLILDEPSQGLDRSACQSMIALVREHVQGGGSVLTITHDPAFVVEVADWVWYLAHGRIALSESVEAVFDSRQSAWRMGLPVPPVVELANQMGWSPERRRFLAAETSVQQTLRR